MPVVSSPDSVRELLKTVDNKQLERVFGSSGFLAKFMKANGRDFEARPEQLEMAQAVAHAIRDRAHLLVEAGTGTGKSYAYLVPFILWALENKKRVLIATGTKALQQQLIERDLPFLSDLFKKHLGTEFKAALCLGTANYICPRRLAKAQIAGLFASTNEVEQLQKLHKFAEKSSRGRNIDLPFEPLPGLWAQVNRESDLCLGRNCQLFDDSFYYKARREQEKAQILVANHHLLFAQIASGGNAAGVLPPFDALVIDEAHHAEDVAASYLGMEVSNLGAAKLIELIVNRRTNKTVLSSARWPEKAIIEERLTNAANEARVAVGQFFENLQMAVNFDLNRGSSIRIKQPNLIENSLSEPFGQLERILKEARTLAETHSDDELTRELEGYASRCSELRKAIKTIVAQSQTGYVYWTQCTPRPPDGPGKTPRVPRLSVHGAPIEVAESLRTSVFEAFRPVVLTSATLTTGGSFEFLADRLGLTSKAPEPKKDGATEEQPTSEQSAAAEEPFELRTLTLGSPFDYSKNALVYVASDLPDPLNQLYWEEAAVKRAAEVVKRTDGKAFILCTSYRLVDKTANLLERVMPKHIRILKQGATARGKLLQEFRSDTHSVLVGTTSFWQGVDVPGESLSCVIIMKLPFAVPDEPLVQARVETIKQKGRDAFNEYQVPQAVMMFRQGFGRLIRTASDRGVVAILDPRVKTKAYGRTFLKSLPECEVTEEIERLSLFISGV